MGKIGAVHIPSYGILRNINPQQRIIVLLDRRYRFPLTSVAMVVGMYFWKLLALMA